MQLGETGEGYQYLRSRARSEDVTIYLHQLAALEAGYSVSEVFAEDTEVHHRYSIQEWNVPENVTVVDVDEHVKEHNGRGRGRPSLAAIDGGGTE